MDLQSEKIELVKRLLDTDDMSIIKKVKKLFEYQEKDNWNNLPQHVKEGILKGREQAKAGKLTAHDDVMNKYAHYL